MIKKLFLWSVLLMTGFAFYSCDDVIDNPATGKQDPSNPNATWTYEVSVKFDNAQTYQENGTLYKFEAPQTLYVFNQKFEQLGAITCDEEIDQDNYAANFYKFAGTLKGAIGDTLIIATIDDPATWYAEKQDGTIANIFENGILELGQVPIIVTNTSTGKIGTQHVKLQNKTFIIGLHMSQYAVGKEKYITISSDAIRIPGNTMTITFAEDVDLNDKFWVAYPVEEGFNSDYFFKTTSEDGDELFAKWNNYIFDPGDIYWTYWIDMWPKTIDLKKHIELFGNWVYINVEDATITQSGEDPISCNVYFYGAKNITIKDLNIESGRVAFLGWGYGPMTVNIEGNNIINSPNYYYAVPIQNNVTFKGNGTLTATGYYYGIYISGSYDQVYIDNENVEAIPYGLTIEEGVTVKAKANQQGVYVSSIKGNEYWYKKDGEWMSGIFDEEFDNALIVNGTLESEGDNQGIMKYGKILIGETGVVKATSNNAWQKILDCNIEANEETNWGEAALETLVADPSKFSDEMSEDNKVRTITPKK